jgi:hypothetical protein
MRLVDLLVVVLSLVNCTDVVVFVAVFVVVFVVEWLCPGVVILIVESDVLVDFVVVVVVL